MAKKVIFRRIKGRLIPIFKKGIGGKLPRAKITKKIYKASPAIRKALKKKIAAKTSLSEKRMNAIRSVTNFLKGEKGYGKRFKLIGQGSDLKVYSTGDNVIKAHRASLSFFNSNEHMYRRFTIKSFLSKKKLAPETFMVSTNYKSYLVQKKVKPLQIRFNTPSGKNKLRKIDDFEKKMKKYSISATDVRDVNVTLNKKTKQIQTIDAGHYSFKTDNKYDNSIWNKSKTPTAKKAKYKKQVENLNKALRKRKDQFWIRNKKK